MHTGSTLFSMGSHGQVPVTTDAVLLVPGIMGSELVDGDGKVVWGLNVRALGQAWVTGRMDQLKVTDDDLAGRPRLRPTRLLRAPAFMPGLHGIEPYTALLKRLSKEVAVDPRAVGEFAYDWRLSVEHNGKLLAQRCIEHLDHWQAVVSSAGYADPAEVRLVLVAHSMGGLVARYATEVGQARTVVRRIVTLGTPFFGAVKAVQMLATGKGAPIPQRAARGLAVTCPGVYDLLPRYKCVTQPSRQTIETGDTAAVQLRLLTPDDVAAVGASHRLAVEASDRYSRLDEAVGAEPGVPVSALVGAEQPTLQSLSISSGECRFEQVLLGIDHGGDGTVYRQAAAPLGVAAFPLPQRHGALAKTAEAITFVRDKLIGADTGPPLGTRPIGIDLPSAVGAGQVIEVRVSGTGDPVGVEATSTDLDTGARTGWAPGLPRDGGLLFSRAGLGPGLHRVEVKAGGFSPVSELVLVWTVP
jgi:pimeloyl-ACP methyl ester carboxylesterase